MSVLQPASQHWEGSLDEGGIALSLRRDRGEERERLVTRTVITGKLLSSLTSLGEANCCFPIILTFSSSLAHKGLLQSGQFGP